MYRTSGDGSRQSGDSTDKFGTTRRAVLAAGGTVLLGGLAGCSALDGLLDSASQKVVGTTASAPAAFYSGRPLGEESASSANTQMGAGETMVYRTDSSDIRRVPASVQADSRTIDLEGWSISGPTKAKDLNSSRSNKPRSEWWVGPDDDIDDDGVDDADGVPYLKINLELLGHVNTAQEAVDRRAPDEAKRALDAFSNATLEDLRPALEKCGTDLCETIRSNSDIRMQGVRRAKEAVDEGDWTVAVKELAGVEEIVLGDIERLDDEIIERDPERPRFSDIIEYLGDEPTIGERFTVSLPDAKLPGDRGSLAAQLTPERVLSYFAASKRKEGGGRHTPFHNKYRPVRGIGYGDDGCIELDGPLSLHTDLSCGNILSADLDTYTTENRAIVGYSGEGGAFVSGAPASAGTDGKCVFVAADGTLREAASVNGGDVQCWGQNRSAGNGDVLCWGQNRSAGEASVSETLVCPVTVTPADAPTPLPGLFYVRRVLHDDQIIFAGGWILDDGALYEDSATLLFDEGPTEVASLTLKDLEGDAYGDKIRTQFSRDRSQHGSAVLSGEFTRGGFPKEWTLPSMDPSGAAHEALDDVYATVIGKQRDDVTDPDDDGDGMPIHTTVTALDAPLVHLADTTKPHSKFKAEIYVFKDV